MQLFTIFMFTFYSRRGSTFISLFQNSNRISSESQRILFRPHIGFDNFLNLVPLHCFEIITVSLFH